MLDPLMELDQENMRDSDSNGSQCGDLMPEVEQALDGLSLHQQAPQPNLAPNGDLSLLRQTVRQPNLFASGDLGLQSADTILSQNANNVLHLEPFSLPQQPMATGPTGIALQAQVMQSVSGVPQLPMAAEPTPIGIGAQVLPAMNATLQQAVAANPNVMGFQAPIQGPGNLGVNTTAALSFPGHHPAAAGKPMGNVFGDSTQASFHPIDPNVVANGTGDYSQLLMQEPLWDWETIHALRNDSMPPNQS